MPLAAMASTSKLHLSCVNTESTINVCFLILRTNLLLLILLLHKQFKTDSTNKDAKNLTVCKTEVYCTIAETQNLAKTGF
jgi:hypothetical protein